MLEATLVIVLICDTEFALQNMEKHNLVPWVVGFAVAWRGERTLKKHLDLGVVLLCSWPPSNSDVCRRAPQEASQTGIPEAITQIVPMLACVGGYNPRRRPFASHAGAGWPG